MYQLTNANKLILASSSPRRRELLSACGISFDIEVPDCDETVIDGEKPQALVRRLSRLKAKTIADKFPDAWVLAADTIVVVDGEIMGKPLNAQDAFSMLQKIQGRQHQVWGGIAFINLSKGIEDISAHSTDVEMRELSQKETWQYIESGEPMDKAGAYAIQGIGASLVKQVNGSYTNVVGLNLSAVFSILKTNSLLAA